MQQVGDLGLEILGPRCSPATLRLPGFARSNRLPLTWRDPERGDDPDAAALLAGLDRSSLPLVRLPGGVEMQAPSLGELSRALGIGRELARQEKVDLLVVGAGPAGLGAAVYGADLFEADGAEFEIYHGLREIPPYDEDYDTEEAPEAVSRIREAVRDADAVFFVTPEYNSSIPGA